MTPPDPPTAEEADAPSVSAVATPVRADRAAAVVLASAAGDALGAGYEFGPPLGADVAVRMVGGGAFGWEPGEWTDDTQMALAVLTALAAGDADPLPAVEAGFRAWFASGPADVGGQTAAVLRSPDPYADVARRAADAEPERAGNGSLMRTGPVALAHPGDPAAIAALAREVSALTHATDDCVDACVLWSVAIDHTLHHAPVGPGAFDWASGLRAALTFLPEERQLRWRQRIEEAADGVPLEFPRNGWVVHAFQAALAAICSTPVPPGPWAGGHLVEALELAVRAGGDTDTVAAIAGSLLGARWGATAVPLRWRRLVHGRRTYSAPLLEATDLERMARLAFRGGRTDAQGWPSVETMVPHYLAEWPMAPVRVERGGVWLGNVAVLDGALADGADLVVSLCRMGTAEVPDGVEHHALGLLDSTPEENPHAALLLADLAALLDEAVAAGRQVFVHCVQAENRTPAAAIAWLVSRGAAPDDATEEVATALRQPKPFLVKAATELRPSTREAGR